MQAAGELVVLAGEFSAGVQSGEDDFDAAYAFLFVDINRYAAAVVAHAQRAVPV